MLPFLKLLRNARNSIEHPKVDQRVEVFDITLQPDGNRAQPALKIIHPDTHQPSIAVVDFMAQCGEHLADTFELMLAFLFGFNVQPFAASGPSRPIPPDLQKAFGVRFGYGVYNGETVIPFG